MTHGVAENKCLSAQQSVHAVRRGTWDQHPESCSPSLFPTASTPPWGEGGKKKRTKHKKHWGWIPCHVVASRHVDDNDVDDNDVEVDDVEVDDDYDDESLPLLCTPQWHLHGVAPVAAVRPRRPAGLLQSKWLSQPGTIEPRAP